MTDTQLPPAPRSPISAECWTALVHTPTVAPSPTSQERSPWSATSMFSWPLRLKVVSRPPDAPPCHVHVTLVPFAAQLTVGAVGGPKGATAPETMSE